MSDAGDHGTWSGSSSDLTKSDRSGLVGPTGGGGDWLGAGLGPVVGPVVGPGPDVPEPDGEGRAVRVGEGDVFVRDGEGDGPVVGPVVGGGGGG
ncbi:MAG TPA: hypothetical protein VNN79_13380, partial [Actinomycetota bacterium]|nr:hypothetical protein [Actinomycetota bacterium]